MKAKDTENELDFDDSQTAKWLKLSVNVAFVIIIIGVLAFFFSNGTQCKQIYYLRPTGELVHTTDLEEVKQLLAEDIREYRGTDEIETPYKLNITGMQE